MPATPDTEMVEFSAKVPRRLYDEFKALVPMYGGTQWFINSSLAGFVSNAHENPTLAENVAASVEAMLKLNRTLKEASTA